MLLELTVAEQHFNAVLEVLRDGLTVVEAAERYGVSSQAVRGWLGRYSTGGLDALADRSTAPTVAQTRRPRRQHMTSRVGTMTACRLRLSWRRRRWEGGRDLSRVARR